MFENPARRIRRLRLEFKRLTGFTVKWVAPDGTLQTAGPVSSPTRLANRTAALQEALRWGEPCVMMDAGGAVGWAVPLMCNAQVFGGLVVEDVSMDDRHAKIAAGRVRAGCSELLRLAVEFNLTNADCLAARRAASSREREKAEAIHMLKGCNYDEIRDLYLREEPVLLAAIKRGERGAAREIVNRVLVGIHRMARDRPNLLKSLALELVVMMSRAAVESGADPALVLGCNFDSATALAALSREEDVSAWLANMLERVMDAIRDNRRYPNAVLLVRAVAFMEEHMGEALDRDTVARAAGLSGSHFSHLIREKTGRTFTDWMVRCRVDRAKALLRRTDKSLVQISLESGFGDQSYFNRVFKRHTGTTPRAFREQSSIE
ncbi:MAG: helix-turn-helix transcriptional regulator [Verrucomicrobia bacterium]|nr:helix-turn-helix transcriptional regulator [Verrucomicrobiota bacterium]